MFKECSQCGNHKPIDAFHLQKGGMYGRHSQCRECRRTNHTQTVEYIEDCGMLRCSMCGERRIRTEFYVKSGTKRGYSSGCKECLKQKRMEKQEEWQDDLDIYIGHLIDAEASQFSIEDIRELLKQQEFQCYITGHTMTYRSNKLGHLQQPFNISVFYDDSGVVHLVCRFIHVMLREFQLDETGIRQLYGTIANATTP